VLYGFASDLIEHMVLKTLQPDAVTHFGLEDVFAGEYEGDAFRRPMEANAGKLAWVTGWRKLPHLTPEVQKLFDYPQQFAEDVFDRIERALRRRVSDAADGVVRTGRLVIVPGDHPSDLPSGISDRRTNRWWLRARPSPLTRRISRATGAKGSSFSVTRRQADGLR
jgi:hypothetical protein